MDSWGGIFFKGGGNNGSLPVAGQGSGENEHSTSTAQATTTASSHSTSGRPGTSTDIATVFSTARGGSVRVPASADSTVDLSAMRGTMPPASFPAPWSVTMTTVPIPTMMEGMTFKEYKNKVNLWVRNMDIAGSRRACLLLMQLPTTDKHGGLHHIMYDRIPLKDLEKDDRVDVLLGKLAEILEDPDFVRLANW